jgi:hypothetical protein
MKEKFADMLVEGKRNSLGRVSEVVAIVLHDKSRLAQLYRQVALTNKQKKLAIQC